jgi:hypothetical protein
VRGAALMMLVLLLSACGGSKPSTTLSVVCGSGTQLVGAASIEALGELANGQPVLEFPDPANPGKTGAIAVPPHDHCKITPSGG